MNSNTLAVITAYKVSRFLPKVVAESLDYFSHILVVDDACPEQSGRKLVELIGDNEKVTVIRHDRNKGVGGAMKTGFAWALEHEFDYIVKIDGDGQMEPSLAYKLVEPLKAGVADFSKGNRFDSPRSVRQMPFIRLVGNGFLSLISKISSGYWSVNDPTNGFIAIRKDLLRGLEFELLSDDYFFESDLLFRLSLVRAKIFQVPMPAKYGEEVSSLKIWKVFFTFPALHLRNFMKRVLYIYYVRDWSIGSVELPAGLALSIWGIWFGFSSYQEAQILSRSITAGEAVASAIGVILGFQLLLSFFSVSGYSTRAKGEPTIERL